MVMLEQQTQHISSTQSLFFHKFYWLKKLAGELPETNFITDYIRPENYRGKDRSLSFELPKCLSVAILKLTRNSDFAIYLVLLSAFKILLKKYVRNNDIIVGTPVYPQGIDIVSNHVIPLRSTVSDRIAFKDFLLQVKETAIAAYSHQSYPFERLVKLLNIPSNQNRCSIFDIVFLLENIHSKNDIARLNNDLTFSFAVNGNAIAGKIDYSGHLFRASSIDLISKHYINTLKCIIKNPHVQVSDINCIDPIEENQLLHEFNQNSKNYPVTQTIHQLFEQQVKLTPNKTAVHAITQLTYQQLNEAANQVAHLLRNLDIHTGELVGILKERDLNFPTAILAILKAGGVYLPIDSSYPLDRIKYMLSHSGIKVLLTDSSFSLDLIGELLEQCDRLKYIIYLDAKPNNLNRIKIVEKSIFDRLNFEQLSKENPVTKNCGTEPAYVIYTSGSTGLPKGAIIRHGGAINHIYAQFDALEFTEDFSFLQSAPASSDISVWQFLAPLLIGGKTVIVDTETVANPEKLFQAIQQQQITIAELVPIVLANLIRYISHLPTYQRALPALKWMMVTGESASVELVNQWLHLYPKIKVVNAYGPTEAADDITQFIVEQPLPENQRTVPIGKPLANLNLYILDRKMQLLPIGVAGEICVSGFGVGAGYWKNEVQTQVSFVPNPFPTTTKLLPGVERDLIYKTGDLGRWLPDGNLEFLGRIDHQVKIRGFRIELGEIEALLSQHPAVRETVVIVREDSPGDKRLVAYIVPCDRNLDNQLDNELALELRNFLKPKLPDYMMPSAFVQLEALPLTPNYKIDRQALPAPLRSQPNPEQYYIAPRTPVEEVIAGIWSQLLGVEQVSVDDNFFELGGHSLLATQLISRLRHIFQLQLPLRHIFEFPTLKTLATAIEDVQAQVGGLQTPPISPVPRDAESVTLSSEYRHLPLSFAQQRLWFIAQLEPDSAAYNLPDAVRLVGTLNIPALEQSLNEIVRRHEILRTNFTVIDGQPVQVIAPTLSLQLPVIDLQELPETQREAEVSRLATQAAQQPFNLAQEPLLRGKILKLSSVEHIVLFAMHHIVSDGWSKGILIRELGTLYEAFSTGKPPQLPELTIQYGDFAYWQRQCLQGEVLKTHLAYWQKHLAGAPDLDLTKIANHSAPVVSEIGKEQSFLLSPDLTEKLKQLSCQEGVTLFMSLMAVFQTLLYRYTNQDDIVIGTDVASRDRPEIEPLIGFFVNLLVLRTDLSGNPSFRELLERVREVALGAYAHQDLPFAKLVEVMQPNRTASQTPLFQVLFVFQNEPTPALEFSGIHLSSLDINPVETTFDLVLMLQATEQGIAGFWKYNTNLFNNSAIARLSRHFQTLISSAVTQPDARIDALEFLSEMEKKQQAVAQNQREKASFQKFKSVKPKAVSVPKQLVTTDFLQLDKTLPLLIRPAVNEIDVFDWAKNQQKFIEAKLLEHGAILFRGFKLTSVDDFENLAQAICPELFGEYGDLPREGISNKVYGSTPYPADQAILFHNESSHLHQYPLKIWFFCVQPSLQGGETPIIDCRQVYQMLDSKLREKFEQKQLMYVRNYTEGLDVSWQDFFHTTDKAVVENYCRQAGINFEWQKNNGLITSKVCPAVSQHPKTGEIVFFNQLQLHHVSCLDPATRKSLLSMFGEENLPRNVYYGDSSPIEDSVMAEINAVYQQAQVSFPWQQGDVLMLDNMLTAHGRNAYKGARKIVVAMGEIVRR